MQSLCADLLCRSVGQVIDARASREISPSREARAQKAPFLAAPGGLEGQEVLGWPNHVRSS